ELVVALKSGGRNIKVDKALDTIWGYGVGIDLTRRDLQIASRNQQRPWEIGKAFDASAPCGPLRPASEIGHPKKGRITLKCSGKSRTEGDLEHKSGTSPENIANRTELGGLVPGDNIMPGAPGGVAEPVAGDRREGESEGVGKRPVTVGPPLK